MIAAGQPAPDFEAQLTDGRTIHLRDLRGKGVVLYFFPKAFTAGWTREAAQFRDAYPEIQRLGGEILGVSHDDHQTQCAFSDKLKTGFPMIADPERKIIKAYGLGKTLVGTDKRVTFVIDKAGIVRAVFHHELLIHKHVDQVLAMFRAGF